MGQRPIVIRVEDLETSEAWTYVFEVGPVLLGRGPDAALRILRPFVSTQHGTFACVADSVRFIDLDSKNGTLIDGALVAGGERDLSERSEIRIGPLRLMVTRTPPEGPPTDPAKSPFARPADPAIRKAAAKPETDVISKEMMKVYSERLQPAPLPSSRSVPAEVAAPSSSGKVQSTTRPAHEIKAPEKEANRGRSTPTPPRQSATLLRFGEGVAARAKVSVMMLEAPAPEGPLEESPAMPMATPGSPRAPQRWDADGEAEQRVVSAFPPPVDALMPATEQYRAPNPPVQVARGGSGPVPVPVAGGTEVIPPGVVSPRGSEGRRPAQGSTAKAEQRPSGPRKSGPRPVRRQPVQRPVVRSPWPWAVGAAVMTVVVGIVALILIG